MANPSDADTALTITVSTPKKSPSPRQSLKERASVHWPFTRMDPKLLERANKQKPKPDLSSVPPATF